MSTPNHDGMPAEPERAPEPETAAPVPPAPEPDAAPDASARRSRTRAPRAESRGGGRKASTKRRAPASDSAPARGPRYKATDSQLEGAVSDTLHGIAMAVMLIDARDGAVIVQGEPRLTAAVIATAKSNPRFRKWLEGALAGGAYFQLLTAVAAIAIPIAANHLPLPGGLAFAATRPPRGAGAVPDAVPVEWDTAPVAPVHEPGVIYRDEQGAYTVDEHGNVTPFVGDDAGAPAFPGGDAEL